MVTVAGVAVTEIGGGFTVTVAAPVLLVSATLFAVTVTFTGAATVAGAVYNPVAEIVPALAVHVTF